MIHCDLCHQQFRAVTVNGTVQIACPFCGSSYDIGLSGERVYRRVRLAKCRDKLRRDDTLVRGSSYLDVAETHPEWLGEPFIQEAEYLSDTNELAWRWEYLGEITGTGGAVFDNVHEAELSDSRIRRFERVRNGVNWGWFLDPWRFVRCAWEASEKRLLIFEEHSANKTMPIDTGRIVVDSLTFPDESGGEPYFHNQIVYADDTPDSKVQMSTWLLDARYPEGDLIRVVLDNVQAHKSRETRAYLATVPGRFEFVFTPKHGSWLNLVEGFFSKMTRQMLRGIRVSSKDELAERIYRYFDEVNAEPVVYRWKRNLSGVDPDKEELAVETLLEEREELAS